MHYSNDVGLIIMKTTIWNLAEAKGALLTKSHLFLPAPDKAGSPGRNLRGSLAGGNQLAQHHSARKWQSWAASQQTPPDSSSLHPLEAPIPRLDSTTPGSSHMLFLPQNSVPSPLICQLSASSLERPKGHWYIRECLSPSLPSSCLLDPFLALVTTL